MKRLLSRWVSGLEPHLAMDQDYRVMGLSYGNEIVLHDEEYHPAPPWSARTGLPLMP